MNKPDIQIFIFALKWSFESIGHFESLHHPRGVLACYFYSLQHLHEGNRQAMALQAQIQQLERVSVKVYSKDSK